MILCVCANVSESTVKSEVEKGLTMQELVDKLGVCKQCCCCEQDILDILENK